MTVGILTADSIHIGVVCELKYVRIIITVVAIVAVECTGATIMVLITLIIVFLSGFVFVIVTWKVLM